MRGRSTTLDSSSWHAAVPDDFIEDTCLYGDEYYALGREGLVVVINPENGRILRQMDLQRALPKQLSRLTDFYPLLVSETHIWVGVRDGYVFAFERDGGKLAWRRHPKGAGSFQRQTYFAAVDGVFLYADMSCRMYCLRQQ